MPSRRAALERGFGWLDDNVPYSQTASHEGYRTDCSGFVSMCWDLGKSSNSAAFYAGDSNTKLSGYDDLIAADALVRKGHVLMFVGWNDEAKTGMCVLEQSSTKNDMQFRVRTTASMKSQGYKAIRATKLADETGVATDDGRETAPADDPISEPVDGTCSSRSIGAVCAEAKAAFAVQCGHVIDECGKEIDCSKLPAFRCGGSEECVDGVCVCVPKTSAEACRGACGGVEDGCGDILDCGACAPVPPREDDAAKDGDAKDGDAKDGDAKDGDAKDGDAKDGDAKDVDKVAASDVGDPGDDGDESSPQSKGSDGDTKKPAGKSVASAGCSAAPRDAGGAMPFVALAFGVALAGRRRRSPAR